MRYPLYVISKGRWAKRLTIDALTRMGVMFWLVVEPQEYDKYAAHVDSSRILTLPFSNLGRGSIPARNWVWRHSRESGAEKHWILDDNIKQFYRLNRNAKLLVFSDAPFRVVEDFTDRYMNIGLSGMNYASLVKYFSGVPAYYLNSRVYSCILIPNDLPMRWRGIYNEDTDLSLRVLKMGLCTVNVNTFLADKQATLTMKGGNTDELYRDDGRLKMAESLVAQHPDVASITWRFNRWQHLVNYREIKQRLIRRPGLPDFAKTDSYGLVLKRRGEQEACKRETIIVAETEPVSSPTSAPPTIETDGQKGWKF